MVLEYLIAIKSLVNSFWKFIFTVEKYFVSVIVQIVHDFLARSNLFLILHFIVIHYYIASFKIDQLFIIVLVNTIVTTPLATYIIGGICSGYNIKRGIYHIYCNK